MNSSRRCFICNSVPCKYTCDGCGRQYCDSLDCGKHIYYHLDSDLIHSSTSRYFFNCCESCCSQCYSEICSVCGALESNLEMTVINGEYRCNEHLL